MVSNVPRSTYTYLVVSYFAHDQPSMRNQVLGRYPGFLKNLRESPSTEVRFLVNVLARDPSSNTAENIKYIKKLTGTCPWSSPASSVKATLPVQAVPDSEKRKALILWTPAG